MITEDNQVRSRFAYPRNSYDGRHNERLSSDRNASRAARPRFVEGRVSLSCAAEGSGVFGGSWSAGSQQVRNRSNVLSGKFPHAENLHKKRRAHSHWSAFLLWWCHNCTAEIEKRILETKGTVRNLQRKKFQTLWHTTLQSGGAS